MADRILDSQVILIEESVTSLIEFQKKLSAIYDSSTGNDRADLNVGDEHWRYIRHGAGVNFIRYADELSVDMEKDVHDPDKISAWRLALFLESKGIYFEESLIKDLLNKSKIFMKDGNFYRVRKKSLFGKLAKKGQKVCRAR